MTETKAPQLDILTRKDKRILYGALIGLGIFGIIAIFVLPALFSLHAPKDWMVFNSRTNDVSSTVNGIASPFIALAAAFLTFLAFWIQYRANILQKAIFMAELNKKETDDEGSEKTWKIEQFENRFYELIRLHKANVDKMKAGNTTGRGMFGPMFYELRYTYFLTEIILRGNRDLEESLPIEFDLLNFCYTLFFFGVGPNSEINFLPGFREKETELFEEVKHWAKKLRDWFRTARETESKPKTSPVPTLPPTPSSPPHPNSPAPP